MQIDVLTLFPEFFNSPLNTSIIKRAIETNKVSVNTINIRDFSTDKHKTADDRPFGGGCGMLMKPEPIFDSIESLKLKPNTKIIMLCPTGEKYTQEKAFELSQENHLVFVCGHYEGIDQRVIENIITEEISVGDYVLTGGELAALTVIDSIIRLIPGVIGNQDSFNQDSFSDGLLDCPHYTRPSEYKGFKVPDVLMSGNHQLIAEWRLKEKLKITLIKRPDLFKDYNFKDIDYKILEKIKDKISSLDINIELKQFLDYKISENKPKKKKKTISLNNLNWNTDNKEKLENLINNNSFQNKKVIFDFDNTIICRDISESAFLNLVNNNLIDIEKIKGISPDFVLDNQLVSLGLNANPVEYYEKFMYATFHQNKDQSEIINGYSWLVQAMTGLNLSDLVKIVKETYNQNTNINNGKYLTPFFYSEMLDLIGNLIIQGFNIYIVSASNVWTVRYMVTEFLNNLLKEKFQKDIKIHPKNVYGINTLIIDKRDKQLYKDIHLIKKNKDYLNSDINELANYEITNQLVQPISSFDGKYHLIEKYILSPGEKAFLICGDSPNDLAMLKQSENKLWIERSDKIEDSEKIKSFIDQSWLIQKVNTINNPGFIN